MGKFKFSDLVRSIRRPSGAVAPKGYSVKSEKNSVEELTFASEATPVASAMKIVVKAMQEDPDYAWSWHCNIAMAFVDAGGDPYTGNQGAARFMKLLADVEPAHELPTAQPSSPPKEEHMELRDLFAATAMQGLLSDFTFHETYEETAERSYQQADAMLKARNHG